MTIPRGLIPGRNQYNDILNGSQLFEKIQVDNLKLDQNTISTTNTNGDICLTPNGTGNVKTSNLRIGTDTNLLHIDYRVWPAAGFYWTPPNNTRMTRYLNITNTGGLYAGDIVVVANQSVASNTWFSGSPYGTGAGWQIYINNKGNGANFNYDGSTIIKATNANNIDLNVTGGGCVNISASGLQIAGNNCLTSTGYMHLPAGDGTAAPNGSLYLDSTTGDLMFKDGAGNTHTVVDIA